MLHQALEFQKTLCDSSFTIATSVQENCENIMKDMLELSPWLPEQGKKACLDYSEQYWLGLNKCRRASLSGIDYLEQLISPLSETKKKGTAQKTAAKANAETAKKPRTEKS